MRKLRVLAVLDAPRARAKGTWTVTRRGTLAGRSERSPARPATDAGVSYLRHPKDRSRLIVRYRTKFAIEQVRAVMLHLENERRSPSPCHQLLSVN
jgi:hypothetical protein